jgi:hypothetical protein
LQPATRANAENDGDAEEFFIKKPVPGAPDIAHPDDPEKYEWQTTFVTAWFLEMWERMTLNDDKSGQPGHEARVELQTLLLNTIGQVLRIALGEKDGLAKKWAGELLAIIGVSIAKHDQHNEKLKANSAYAEMKKKLSGKGLTSALFPTYVCGIAQHELKTAEECRMSLLLLREGCGDGWALAARWEGILEEYWPAMELPDFSQESEPRWWEFLWPFIEKRIDVSKLPPLRLREYDEQRVLHNLRTGKTEMRPTEKTNRRRYPSDSPHTARGHLMLLARLRAVGIY